MSRFFSGLVGAVVEAWAELRIHRTRVLLSLIGVAVAVAAITAVVGVGQIAQQATTESFERQSGRPAMLSVSAYNPETGVQATPDSMDEAFATALERYSITYSSHTVYASQGVQFADGYEEIQSQVVDPDYGTMHRVRLLSGSWFTDADDQRLAPAVIVNEFMWKRLGSPDLATHPTIELSGTVKGTAVIIGVTPSGTYDQYSSMYMDYQAWLRITPPEVMAQFGASYELWVPPAISEELVPLLQRDISGALGSGYQTDVYRNDYLAFDNGDPLLSLKLVVGGVAALVLLLGALGLVNISLVTVKQRIREIGIRRSFGATAGRVFFAVMMESIVATLVAGVVGVIIAIVVVQNPWVQEQVGQGVVDLPPFPVEAALIGLGCSVAVGAIAGLLPALVAVRVKVIDAIRY